MGKSKKFFPFYFLCAIIGIKGVENTFDIFKVVSQYQKLSEDVYKLSREVSLLNNRLDNNDVKHITMYSHDIEKLKEILNESTDSQSN